MNREVKQTVFGLLCGIVVWTVVLAVLTVLTMGCLSGWNMEHTKVILGFITGGALAGFMAVHMAISLNKAVELDEQGALNHTRKMYAIRTAIVLTCAVVLFFTGWVNILAVFAGLFGLKPAAYAEPLFRKLFFARESKIEGGEDDDDTC